MKSVAKIWAMIYMGSLLSILIAQSAITPVLAQTPASSCDQQSGAILDADLIAELYDGKAATGTEAAIVTDLLTEYGAAIKAGDSEQIVSLVTPEFDAVMGFSACPELYSERAADPAPDMLLTPMRVTTDGEGTWLGFIQRSYDDGSEVGYRDVFMVIAVTQPDGSMRIDFTHKDIRFADGSWYDAETIYMTGDVPGI